MNGQFLGQDFNLLDMLPVTAYDLTLITFTRSRGPYKECDSYFIISSRGYRVTPGGVALYNGAGASALAMALVNDTRPAHGPAGNALADEVGARDLVKRNMELFKKSRDLSF